MWKKRAVASTVVFFIGFSILLARLMQIQLFETESFTGRKINLLEESVNQRIQELIIDNGRGDFLDRNGEMLTNGKIPVLVLFPFLKRMNWDEREVARIAGISEKQLHEALVKENKPFSFGDPNPYPLTVQQMKKINALKIPGVLAVERKFDRSPIPAQQLIGLIGENAKELLKRYPHKNLSAQTPIGITGLEKSFDEFLLPEGKEKLVYHVDGEGGPLFGMNVKYVDNTNPFYPVRIQTTLDKEIQLKAEQLTDQYGIKKGGLVLLDLQDSSVLAMVSRPSMDKERPFDGAGTANQMLKQQIMGSIFKTVTAAAAIDHHLDNQGRLFNCSKKINGQPDLTHNYGMLNFEDSFARSCNRTFGELALDLKKIDPSILEQYAEKLSLIGPVAWQGNVYHSSGFKQMDEEEAGRVFLNDAARKDDNFVKMTGIGQDEVRATPLAVANMMATIARGGKKESVRVVSEIQYKNKSSMVTFKSKEIPGESISPYTAMQLQKLLRKVVTNEHGTGRWFQRLPYAVAGKSGTGETEKYVEGRQLHNKWFAGYFPYQHPRYVLVVVNLDVMENEGGVNQLYLDMVKWLFHKNHS